MIILEKNSKCCILSCVQDRPTTGIHNYIDIDLGTTCLRYRSLLNGPIMAAWLLVPHSKLQQDPKATRLLAKFFALSAHDAD